MDFLKSMMVAASGLKAQSGRMKIIAENIANADSTGRTAQDEPYRRKVPTFSSRLDSEMGVNLVKLGKVEKDRTEFNSRYEPGHPAANAEGYVKTPNVNVMIETVDMKEAQRTYEANLNIISSTRQMLQRTIDILRG
ncbi:MAG: flagellar basal body rod protein FlgC [Stappiaceae bacterium]